FHVNHGRGTRMVVDLTNVVGRLLALIGDAILKRSRDLYLLGNEGVTVALKNGQMIQGIARNRSNYSLQVVDRDGALHLISMADVKELTVSERSLMPSDYGARLSKQEIDDLLAYLSRQVLRPGKS